MPKRKIEAEVAVSVSGIDDVTKLEEKVDGLQDTEIAVDADTSDARSAIERFGDELDDLGLDSSRELRIEFKAQLLQQQVRSALRDLERLEDPIEIRTRTADLEQAQQDLRDLQELASRKYQVDVDIDPRRNAARAADDIDRIRQKGEGLQSATPALRGFTDELGDTAANAGIAGQALGDLGDFSLILGERFGLSEKATTQLGTALGAAGLATVILGTALPAIEKLFGAQDELSEKTLAAADALGEQSGAVDDLKAAIDRATEGDPLVQAILGQFGDDEDKLDDITDALSRLGLTIDEDLGEALRALRDEETRIPILERLPEIAERSEQDIKRIDQALRDTSGFDNFIGTLRVLDPELADFARANRDVFEDLVRLDDAANEIDLGAAYREALVDIQKTTEGTELLAEAQRNVGANAGIEELLAEYQRLRGELEETETATKDVERSVRDATGAWGGFEDAARSALGAILDDSTAAVEALDPVAAALYQITGQIDEEQTILGIADQFDRVAEAAQEAAKAQAEGSEDAEKKARDYRREQLKLTEDVLKYLETIEDIPLSKVTEVRTAIDQGKLLEAEQLIAELTGEKFTKIYIDMVPRGGFDALGFKFEPGKAPVQTDPSFGVGQFLSAPITVINNPPGTPAATASNAELYAARNGDRSGAV